MVVSMRVNGKTSLKVAILKVLGTVVVAMLGLLGAGLGYLAQVKTDSTDAALKATVEQINTRTIPMLEMLIKEQRDDLRRSRDKPAELRERLAYVEASVASVARRARVKLPAMDKPRDPPSMMTRMVRVLSVEADTGELKEPELIPRLDVRQVEK